MKIIPPIGVCLKSPLTLESKIEADELLQLVLADIYRATASKNLESSL
jgi:hypothetical protein